MHDGMQYDPIQGQGQGHEPFKAISSAIYKESWELTTHSQTRAQYLHLIGPDFCVWLSFFVT